MTDATMAVPTPPPLPGSLAPPPPDVWTKAVDAIAETGSDGLLIAGVVSAVVLLLLICMIAVLLWCLSRHKGSYVTNEMDDEDDVVDDNDDDESDASDAALQSREPLKVKDDE